MSPRRLSPTDNVEAELLHTFTKVYKFDTMLLLVRLAVLTAVTLTVPIVLFPVSPPPPPGARAGARAGAGRPRRRRGPSDPRSHSTLALFSPYMFTA